jgi:hypothetical protein
MDQRGIHKRERNTVHDNELKNKRLTLGSLSCTVSFGFNTSNTGFRQKNEKTEKYKEMTERRQKKAERRKKKR